MQKSIERTYYFLFLLSITLGLGCVKDAEFSSLKASCVAPAEETTAFLELQNLYTDETVIIHDDLVMTGYVISSDKAGNFFGALHVQNSSTNPTSGFLIAMDLRDAHLFYPIGTKVEIHLKGLYLGKSNEVYTLGGAFTPFGNLSVGRLPARTIFEHVYVVCDAQRAVIPTVVPISKLTERWINTLVQIPLVQFSEAGLGKPYAVAREETTRMLMNCEGDELTLVNSGFSDFQAQLLPSGKGSITGVLVKDRSGFYLQIRDTTDIQFTDVPCQRIVDEVSSSSVFISEIADPDNNAEARFVELYNASDSLVVLNGWELVRYTNDATEVSSRVDLSGARLAAKSTLVVAANEEEFTIVYGISPDVNGGANSPADSNGDDTLQLIDPFGVVIDSYGVVGVDGSGTNHEFEDGRAVRKTTVTQANASYTFSEWTVYNDTGAMGTINSPQIAPQDFSPSVRN